MRPLTNKEINKRGCIYCADHTKARFEVNYKETRLMRACPHNICPYRELDKYDTYADYLKHHKDDGIDALVGSVFKLQRDL